MSTVCYCGQPDCSVTSMARDACLTTLRAERNALKAHVANLEAELAQGVEACRAHVCLGAQEAKAERDALKTQVEAWEEKAKVWLMSPEAAKRLDGYRELEEKCARLEAQVEAARSACEKRFKGSHATLSRATARQILDAMDEAAKPGKTTGCDCRLGCVNCHPWLW